MSWMTNLLKSAAPLAAMAIVLGGCKSDKHQDDPRAGDAFRPDDEVTDVCRLADEQIAAGARTDGTLRPYHFRHAGLNALGREKLDYMLEDFGTGSDGEEMVVYLDVPAGDSDADKRLAESRRTAVTEYLAEQGLTEDRFRLESGHNPNNTVPVVSLRSQQDEAPVERAPANFGGGLGDAAAPKN